VGFLECGGVVGADEALIDLALHYTTAAKVEGLVDSRKYSHDTYYVFWIDPKSSTPQSQNREAREDLYYLPKMIAHFFTGAYQREDFAASIRAVKEYRASKRDNQQHPTEVVDLTTPKSSEASVTDHDTPALTPLSNSTLFCTGQCAS